MKILCYAFTNNNLKIIFEMLESYLDLLNNFSFPGSSTGKESACNAGGPSWIPGSGRSPGEGIDYPLHYAWTSPVAQTAENAMQKTWVQSPGWEDPLQEGMITHCSILSWRISWTEDHGRL